MMWKAKQISLATGDTLQFKILKQEEVLSYKEVFTLLMESVEFRSFYNELLSSCPFEAFFWENRPIKKNQLSEDYTFVLVESTLLKRISADPSAFSNYFRAEGLVFDFPNLGGDAHLIVPGPSAENAIYGHLAAFVRGAPEAQQQQFWKRVGYLFPAALGDSPKWLSTAGLGVSWLHVRIDSRPKYYRHRPFKIA